MTSGLGSGGCREGGLRVGRVGTLRVREECRPHPCVREKASPFPRHLLWERWEPLGGWFPASGPQPSRPPHSCPWCHRRAGCMAALGDAQLRSQGGYYGLLFSSSSSSPPAKPRFQFLTTGPAGRHGQTSGSLGKVQPGGQLGPRATNQCLHFFTPPPPSLGGVCQEGKG